MSVAKKDLDFDLEHVYESLTRELVEKGDQAKIKGQQNYFKNEVKFVGLAVGQVRGHTRKVFDGLPDQSRGFIFPLAERLMSSMVFEYRVAAMHLATLLRNQWQDEDFYLFQSWLDNYVDNWATGDEIANHLLDKFIIDNPQITEETFQWSSSKNLWMRRASAVCLIVPMRKQDHIKDVLRVSEALLLDSEEMVQKGYGWALKECSKKHPQEIYEFIMEHKHVMPRTPLRIALEKYDPLRRKAAIIR